MAAATRTGYIMLGGTLALSFCSILLTLMFHRRRAFQPIRSRVWWQSEAIVFTTLVLVNHLAVALEFPDLGHTFFLFAYPLFMASAFATLIRLCHIYSAYQLAAVYAAASSTDGAEELGRRIARGGFFVKYGSVLQSPKMQAIALVMHTILQGALWGGLVTILGEFKLEEELLAAGIVLLLYMVPMLYFAANVATLNDGLFLRREMFGIAAVALISTVVFLPVRLLVEDGIYAASVILFGVPYPIIFILVGFPLYMSYVWEAEANRFIEKGSHDKSFEGYNLERSEHASSSRLSVEILEPERNESGTFEATTKTRVATPLTAELLPRLELKEVLDNPTGRTAFIAFCKLELNHETVLFYLEATKLLTLLADDHDDNSGPGLEARASRIYHKYIKDGAVLQVNLGHKAQAAFSQAGFGCSGESLDCMDKVSAAVRRAREEIYQLMIVGPFVRFLRHKLYRDFIAAIEHEV